MSVCKNEAVSDGLVQMVFEHAHEQRPGVHVYAVYGLTV